MMRFCDIQEICCSLRHDRFAAVFGVALSELTDFKHPSCPFRREETAFGTAFGTPCRKEIRYTSTS